MTRAALLCAFTLLPAVTLAQIPTVPRYVGQASFIFKISDRSPVDILTQHQESGDWNKLQAYARELLKDFGKQPPIAALLGDITENYYNFIWESKNAEGKAIVNRVLVHMKLKPQHAARLPGISYEAPQPVAPATLASEATKALPDPPEPQVEAPIDALGPQLFDVLLSPADVATLSSVYVSTPAVDPATAQLPDVMAKVNILGFAAKATGTEDRPPQILVYVNQPILPVRRAAIKIKDVIETRPALSSLTDAYGKVLNAVLTRQARTSPCAATLANAIKTALDEAVSPKGGVCTNASDACAKLVTTTIDSTYASTIKGCAKETLAPVGFDPVVAVEQEFKKVIAVAGPKQTTGESTLNNTPLTRYSFGLMTGLLIGHTTLREPRLKVDSGKIANAPLDRALSMVVVNAHPWPYDSEWSGMSKAESFRLFGGTVLTPDFGFTGGIGFGLVRGLAVNAGAVFLLSDAAKAGEKVGAEPTDKNDPFRSLLHVGGFVGFSYIFK